MDTARELDLELPGAFPLVWKRWYTSQKRLEKGQLGRGGWSHRRAVTTARP